MILEKRINTYASGVKKLMREDDNGGILVVCEAGEIFLIDKLEIGAKR